MPLAWARMSEHLRSVLCPWHRRQPGVPMDSDPWQPSHVQPWAQLEQAMAGEEAITKEHRNLPLWPTTASGETGLALPAAPDNAV